MGNHPDLAYRGGQRPIVHLQADLLSTVQWADKHGIAWAFSDRNAGTYYTLFHNTLDDLAMINWEAVTASDFRNAIAKEGKQAEFLIHESFPWELVEKIGVMDTTIAAEASEQLSGTGNSPPVIVEPAWYF